MPEIRRGAWLLLCLTAWSGLALGQEFAGSAACRNCHQAEFEAWHGSHHQQAMQVASPETVLGDFGNAEVRFAGVTSRFFRRNGKFFVHTDGADGELADFQITHTFGIDPLQQYLVAFPDGRYQALGIAWDSRPAETGGQRWFHLYADDAVGHDDPMHWTGPQQNWNFMCADCHSTNVKKNYQAASDQFDTTWSEISVGCEACHGPGSAHIAWAGMEADERKAKSDDGLSHHLDERDGVQWVLPPEGVTAQRNRPNTERVEIQVCASCHSRRGIIREGADREASFLDHYMPALLTEGLYYSDGQIEDEVYVWGSFLQSRMYAAGVTCSDCHDPHSQELKLPGDAVCTQCHQAKTFASESHHHHPPESTGARCANCHMPETTYMTVDPRRDHSIRIPRPDNSPVTGAPNACTQCHRDQDDDWASKTFTEWYPGARAPFQSWAPALSAARAGDPKAAQSLVRLVLDQDVPGIARATALSELAPYLDQQTFSAVQAALQDDDPLVRMAAVRLLDPLPPSRALPFGAHLLQDDVLAVRVEAARILAGAPVTQMNEAGRKLLESAIDEYIATQTLNADRSEALTNLGNLQINLDDPVRAESYFRQALKRERNYVPAWANLAELYRIQGLNDVAIETLKAGLKAVPDSAVLQHSLGLALIRSGRQEAALDALRQASGLDPDNARFAYVYGVALNSSGKQDSALTVLQTAHERHPGDQNILFALATIQRDRGKLDAARDWAEKLLALNPGNDQARALLESLEAEEQE